jgi:hypothetical protein
MLSSKIIEELCYEKMIDDLEAPKMGASLKE